MRDGSLDAVGLCTHETVILLLNKNEGELSTVLELPEELTAPLDTEESVGKAVFVKSDGTRVREIALYPAADVLPNGLTDVLRRVARAYLGLSG